MTDLHEILYNIQFECSDYDLIFEMRKLKKKNSKKCELLKNRLWTTVHIIMWLFSRLGRKEYWTDKNLEIS